MFIVASKVAKCTQCHRQVYVSVLAKAVEYKHLLNYYTNYCTYIKFIKFTH